MKTPKSKRIWFGATVIGVFALAAALFPLMSGPAAVHSAAADEESFPSAVVVSVDPIASAVGVDILKKGGNAVDAAIATGLALAVTHPSAGNIGGGGFMLAHLASKGDVAAIDFREKAPEKSTPTMFLDDQGNPDPKKVEIGHLVIGVPGTVRGFWEASQRYGKLKWKDLVAPAVQLARSGFVVDQYLSTNLKTQTRFFEEYPEFGRIFRKEGGAFLEPGDTLVQPDLAWTMQQIHDKGADGFYKGEVAKRLVEGVQAGGGIITLNDLARYDAKVRAAVRGTYRGYELVGMPPSSSGGTTVIQMLNLLENYEIGKMGRRDAATIHLLTETMRIGFYNRAKYLGDTDFVSVDLKKLTSKPFANGFRDRIGKERATRSLELGADIVTKTESPETTHYSVVDSQGNAVSVTYTLEGGYGSKVIAKGTGFLLNNEMHDFNVSPGVTDTKGLIGTTPNLIEPGKRMLSSMSPMIVLKSGKPYLVTGSPGGRTIINTVYQVLVNVIDFNMSAQQAVDEPRIHHQWMPDTITLEKPLESLAAALQEMGHQTRVNNSTQGDAHSILIRDGRKYPGVDRRLRGGAVGY